MSFKFYCYLRSRYWGGQYEVMNLSLFEAVKTEISTIALFHFFLYLACSQTLYFLFKVRGAHVIKNIKQVGFIDRQRKGVGVGEEENRRSLFFVLARPLRSPMFKKRTKSNRKNNVWEQAILYSKGNLNWNPSVKIHILKIVTEVGRSKFSRLGNNLTMVVFTVEHK